MTVTSRTSAPGVITLDIRSLLKTGLSALLALAMSLIGWLLTLAWDQQASNTEAIRLLEKQLAIEMSKRSQMEREHEKDVENLKRWMRGALPHAGQYPPASK